MKDALNAKLADFSGMDGGNHLMIGGVMHKATITVDELGTEAAAATVVIITETVSGIAGSSITINVDHPFMFFIVDRSSGTILFMGRVLDPR